MNNKGFTIIEVLVTLIILSMIAIITSNILQSSLESEKISSQRLNSIKELNLASSILRRDIRQIANVSIKDFYGNKINGTFISELGSENLMFTTKVKSFSNEVSPLKRVQYVIENKNFIRKQYYSSNPYNQDEFTKSIIINDIDNLKLSFLNENKWHQSWPVSPITSKKIPTLIKIEFRLDNKDYSWVINPNIEYALQN
ncbi:MAG: type II secretion system minor pseudopilin GspJ [Gammaproteobacteria bacterium]|jgi:type II secretion system protein J|tara:strand:- start:2463 stop:3059 length:597 start_codon:yes stop_codon:yes gene_type:complete